MLKVRKTVTDSSDYLMNFFWHYKDVYGYVGISAAAAVILKVLLLYKLIGINSNFFLVCLTTCLIIWFLFASFRNKWIAVIIYTLISILMFCDVTYASFFNRYLSVGMIGAAEVVGDIGESIKEVIRPVNFLMFLDVILIYATLIKSRVPLKKKLTRGLVLKSSLSAIILVTMLVWNFAALPLITSLSNQEFFSYHLKDIVDNSFGSEKNDNMAAYTNSYELEKSGPYFGVAKGKNLIVLQLESMQDFVVGLEYNGQEITPNLNRLIESNTIYCPEFYQQIGSGNTSDAEFAANNSLYGTLSSYTYKLFDENYYRGLPALLKEKGYSTAVLHGFENRNFWNRDNAYRAFGFDRYYGGLNDKGREGDFTSDEWMGWGITDSCFYPQAVQYMKDLDAPFYSFVISLSNHHPFEMLPQYQQIKLLPEDEGTIVGNYLNSAAYTDYSVGIFIDELKDAGLYDNSVFVIYGDHVGLTHTDEIDASMKRLLGHGYGYEDMMNVPLIIHMPDETYDIHETCDTAGGQTDLLPTLAYLFGFESLDTLYTGHNILTVDEGFVAEQTYMTKGSFFTNDIGYEMSRDGVFENGRAWNLETDEEIDLKNCYEGYLKSIDVVNTSEYILKSDAIRTVYLEGKSLNEAADQKVSRTYPTEIVIAGWPDAELMGTNSKEALDYSYLQGYRTLRIDILWDDKSNAYTVNSKTGRTAMTWDDMISWLEEHGNAQLVVHVPKSGDYMMNFTGKKNRAAAERMIIEVPAEEEYSGRYEAILDVSDSRMSIENMKEFIDSRKVWAVLMPKELTDGPMAELLDADIAVYIIEDNNGIIERKN